MDFFWGVRPPQFLTPIAEIESWINIFPWNFLQKTSKVQSHLRYFSKMSNLQNCWPPSCGRHRFAMQVVHSWRSDLKNVPFFYFSRLIDPKSDFTFTKRTFVKQFLWTSNEYTWDFVKMTNFDVAVKSVWAKRGLKIMVFVMILVFFDFFDPSNFWFYNQACPWKQNF